MASGSSSALIEKHENNHRRDFKDFTAVQMENELHMFQIELTEEVISNLRSSDSNSKSDKSIILNFAFNTGVFAETENSFYVKFNKSWPDAISFEVGGTYPNEINLIELRYTWLSIDMASDVLGNKGGTFSPILEIAEVRKEGAKRFKYRSLHESEIFKRSTSVFRLWVVVYNIDSSQAFLRGYTRSAYKFSKNHYLDSKFSDIDIIVNDEKLPAHRIILSERSAVFKRMFETKMSESTNGFIKIDDFDLSLVKEFLEFLYTGSCKTLEKLSDGTDSETIETIMKLFQISDKYNVEYLKLVCINILRRWISVENVINIYTFANFHDLKTLGLEAKEFFETNKEKIVPHPQSLIELMKEYDVKVIHDLFVIKNPKTS